MTIRTLIVDDEDGARRRLRSLLDDEADVEVVGECRDGEEALEAVLAKAPDLVFLDVRMPGLDGLEVLDALGGRLPPAVVFATAYDDYAVRAFEARALDYLVKPYSVSRMKETLDRVRERLRAGTRDRVVADALRSLGRELRPRRLRLRSGGTLVFVDPDEVDRIEGDGNYIRVHTGRRSILLRDTLKGILARLPPESFVRIHHSHIVNVRRIRQVRPSSHGEYTVVLVDGTRLSATRTYVGELRARLEL